MVDKYILEGKTPVKADLLTWERWLEDADRSVSRTHVGYNIVSTVFIGIDHNFDDSDSPMLFGTMIFQSTRRTFLLDPEVIRTEGYEERYSTWEEAEKGH